MEREPLPASLLPAPGGTWAFTGLSPTRLIGYARHGGTGATEEKTPGTGPGATEEGRGLRWGVCRRRRSVGVEALGSGL